MITNVHGNTVAHLGTAIVAGRYLPGAAIPFAPIALSYHVVYVAHKKEKAFAAAA